MGTDGITNKETGKFFITATCQYVHKVSKTWQILFKDTNTGLRKWLSG